MEQVRGTGGAALAALLHPGTFLISRNRVLPDEDTLASAPLWLRWIIEHKHKQWIKSVYLITKVEARPGSENGDEGQDLSGRTVHRLGKSSTTNLGDLIYGLNTREHSKQRIRTSKEHSSAHFDE